MIISNNDWTNYIKKLSKISETAGRLMQEYIDKNGYEDRNALIEYAHALVTKYGEGSSELACMMYDAMATAEKANVAAAVPAETATIGETAKAINGSLKQSQSGQLLNSVVQRMVKQSGADTTLKNAIRDRAQFAWVPSGDTCPFCIALASRGWQNASRKALRNGHAEHIHAHCDCQYAIRFNENTDVEGYDPEKYAEMYYSEPGKGNDKINAMRRKNYAENKDAINARKRELYAINKPNSMNRAKTIKTEDDLRKITKSSIIDMKSINEIKDYFSNYNIELIDFDKKELFNVQTVLSGVDDALELMPEAKDFIKTIKYDSNLKHLGTMTDKGIMLISAKGILDYGTGAHETAHAYDYATSKGNVFSSEEILKEARKKLKLRSNSTQYINLAVQLTGKPTEIKKDYEVFAYGIETELSGIDNKLGKTIVDITRNRNAQRLST